MSELQRDQEAFEQEVQKVLPGMGQRAHTYFSKDPDGEYTWPEARFGFACFKLGGNYAVEAIQKKLQLA